LKDKRFPKLHGEEGRGWKGSFSQFGLKDLELDKKGRGRGKQKTKSRGVDVRATIRNV